MQAVEHHVEVVQPEVAGLLAVGGVLWVLAALDASRQGVGGAVGQVVGAELLAHQPRVRIGVVGVVPIGQRPVVGWTVERGDLGADHLLEHGQVAAVPGQEEPAAVLALAPEPLPVRRRGELVIGPGQRIPVAVVVVDRRLPAPAPRIGDQALAHAGHALGVPEQGVVPGREAPKALPDTHAVHCRFHGRTSPRTMPGV